MSDPRYVIARDNWADRLYVEAAFTEVCDLPDAEHVHVTRHPDGTITAVPMRQRGDFGLGDGAYSSIPGGMNWPETRIPLWVDCPTGGEQ
jgi:hypothetical protein